tara:strand:- start:2359 stop:3009 length:651 start_codon:yes stop_codon:yes gene_type:complete
MKVILFTIPIVIGIIIGIIFSTSIQLESENSSLLNKKNLIEGSTILGEKNAEIMIVEFGDYQCTFCYKFHQETFDKIKSNYIDDGVVSYVYRDFPLNGQLSKMASEASYCAQKQEKFWLYHDTLFNNWAGENTGWITKKILISFANDLELDIEKFEKCLTNMEFQDKVLKNEQYARSINIDATPSFLIFDNETVYRIIGAQPYETFEKTIEELRRT